MDYVKWKSDRVNVWCVFSFWRDWNLSMCVWYYHLNTQRASVWVCVFECLCQSSHLKKRANIKCKNERCKSEWSNPNEWMNKKNTTTLNCVCELLTVFVYSIYHMCPSTHIALSNALSVFISFVIPFFLTQFVVYTLISLTLTPCHIVSHACLLRVYSTKSCWKHCSLSSFAASDAKFMNKCIIFSYHGEIIRCVYISDSAKYTFYGFCVATVHIVGIGWQLKEQRHQHHQTLLPMHVCVYNIHTNFR